jgi:acyl carrier protein
MNAREIIDALTDILAEILVLNKSDIRPSRKLVDDLDADSIAFLELTYRLRRDFGLRVPEAKVDEETLRLPLLEGLQRLEQAIGGTTLFEFMKLEAMHDDGHDPELRARSIEILRQSLREPSFAETLKTAVGEGPGDAARAAALLLHQLRQTPELTETVEALREGDAALAECMQTLHGLAEVEIARTGPPGEASLALLWRDAAGMDRAAAELGALKVKQLAYLMGTDIPDGKEPGAPIATLELRDMFRFITVEAYVRYVLHLAASQRPGEVGDADAVTAEVAAWLREQ